MNPTRRSLRLAAAKSSAESAIAPSATTSTPTASAAANVAVEAPASVTAPAVSRRDLRIAEPIVIPLAVEWPDSPRWNSPAATVAASSEPAPAAEKPAPRRGPLAKASAITTALGLVAALSLPVLGAASLDSSQTSSALPDQTIVSDAVGSTSPMQRPGYRAVSVADKARDSALATGIVTTYQNDATADIQWPFLETEPFTDGFGYRDGPYPGMHTGQDFAAPEGTPIRVIADGVVTSTDFIAGMDGQHVKVMHTIDGKEVETTYAHMITGSQTVAVGDVLKVGDIVGQVGATGAATGPHLHLDVKVEGEFVDPAIYLLEHNK